MFRRQVSMPAGRKWDLWPVLLVLLAAALVPAACVLWFMNAAMGNERLAVRQRLTDVYRQRMGQAHQALVEHWAAKAEALSQGRDLPAAQLFARLAASGLADSVVIYDEDGNAAYPAIGSPAADAAAEQSPHWPAAEALEYERAEPQQAADTYARIAKDAKGANLQARAMRAQARCLAKAGLKDQAIGILTGPLAGQQYRNATDTHGRLIAPSAQLLALQLMGDGKDSRFGPLATQLCERLNDYTDSAMPSGQRRFLMRQLGSMRPDEPGFATLAAEELAAEYLADAQRAGEPLQLTPAGPAGRMQMASDDKRVVAIFRADRLLASMRLAAGLDEPCPGATIELAGPVSPSQRGAEPLLSMLAGGAMPNWRLKVYLEGSDPFAAEARRRNAAYLWIGWMGILVIALLALIVARYVGRQVTLTRLKNDLIATVSHELKTPLASMRVLVDTLVEGRCTSDQQAKEYFRLIAKENARLSRLIDNFLTFSRMERNKKAFEFEHAEVAEIVGAAVDSAGDRFAGPGCKLEVQVPHDLPAVYADKDALVTVLLNLLDNAWKYSGDDKEVAIRAYAADGSVCVEVSDNGMGMSDRAVKKIFNRFWQVDQTLSRTAGGCGLGLSIVKFIVDAHGGTIDVASRPGAGSTFTIRLPATVSTAAESRIREQSGGN